jgi:hypothetical protein
MMPSVLNEGQDQHPGDDGDRQGLSEWNRHPRHQRPDAYLMPVLADEHDCHSENDQREEVTGDESSSPLLLLRRRRLVSRSVLGH